MVAWVAGLCVVAWIGVGAGRYWQVRALQARAVRENERLAPAVERCREQLLRFHAAWRRYRETHHGAEPPTAQALLPRYLPDARLFVCPVAAAWMASGGDVEQGTLPVGRRRYPETYSLCWLTASYPRQLRVTGEATPLVICRSHREVIYQAVYDHRPPLGAFADPLRRQLLPEVAGVSLPAVCRDGRLVSLAGDAD
jgi:hypothetical protein